MATVDRLATGTVSPATKAKRYLLFASLFFLPVKPRVRALYAMDGAAHLFGEESLYHNLGSWRDNPATLDEAGDAMARLVGDAAALGSEDRVLDLGFGFVDQDIYWLRRFGPARVVGLDASPAHVAAARRRVDALGLG